jgi:hypothetical protein
MLWLNAATCGTIQKEGKTEADVGRGRSHADREFRGFAVAGTFSLCQYGTDAIEEPCRASAPLLLLMHPAEPSNSTGFSSRLGQVLSTHCRLTASQRIPSGKRKPRPAFSLCSRLMTAVASEHGSLVQSIFVIFLKVARSMWWLCKLIC